jgi:CreA protein
MFVSLSACLAIARARSIAGSLTPYVAGAFLTTSPWRIGRELTLGFAILATVPQTANAEEIASVNTNFRVTGSDRIAVEAYDDPAVQGVTCFVSRARTGGIKGSLGIAEDPSEASIACRQVGPVRFSGPVKQKDNVFSERLSFIFKTLHVVRIVDVKRNTLVYMTYSDRVISGSPKNSISAVPMPEGTLIPLK